jgi:hypothetical protein
VQTYDTKGDCYDEKITTHCSVASTLFTVTVDSTRASGKWAAKGNRTEMGKHLGGK